MSHNIPATPQDNPADTVLAAVAHGMTGHPEKAGPLLEPFILGGPATSVGLCAALAEISAFGPRQQLPKGGTFGLLVLHAADGSRSDINDLPPGIRFAAQFSTAWANRDKATAYALFKALVSEQTDAAAEAFADGVSALYDMAVASAMELAKHRS